MASISVTETVKISISTYLKQLAPFAIAGIGIQSAMWTTSFFIKLLTKNSGITALLEAFKQSQEAGQTGIEQPLLASLINIPFYWYAAIALTYLAGIFFYSYLFVGLAKLSLDTLSTQKSSLQWLKEISYKQALRTLWGFSLIFLLVFAVAIASAVFVGALYFLSTSFLSVPVAQTGAFALFLLLFFGWLGCYGIGYSLFVSCIADKPSLSAFQALQLSTAITYGSRAKIMGVIMAFLVILMPILCVFTFALAFAMKAGYGDARIVAIVLQGLVAMIFFPIGALCNAYMYRKLAP